MVVLEAVILCGNEFSFKPGMVNKSFLEIFTGLTLVDRQIRWLQKHGFHRIILSSDRSDLTKIPVIYSIEDKHQGTAGAVRKAAMNVVKSKKFYVLNVDSLLFSTPEFLLEHSSLGNSLFWIKAELPFGILETDSFNRVLKFKERTPTRYKTTVGHYVFRKRDVIKYFQNTSDIEFQGLQDLASHLKLKAVEYKGRYFKLNTFEDLSRIREFYQEGK